MEQLLLKVFQQVRFTYLELLERQVINSLLQKVWECCVCVCVCVGVCVCARARAWVCVCVCVKKGVFGSKVKVIRDNILKIKQIFD